MATHEEHLKTHIDLLNDLDVLNSFIGYKRYSGNPVKRFLQKIGILKADIVTPKECLDMCKKHIDEHRKHLKGE